MKRFLSLFLALIVAVGICLSAPIIIEAEAAVYTSSFTPRTSIPTASDKWIVKYNTSNNCTRYAYARISEILNTDATSLLGTRPGADGFPTLLQNAGYIASSTPTPGSVMCTSGHVAIVESVNASKGTLVVSEGHSWSSAANMSSVSKYLINGSSIVGYSTLTTDGNGNGTWFDLRTISYTNKSAKYYSLVKSGSSTTISYSTITNGLYYLKNNSYGTYLAVAEDKDANGQPINLWNKSVAYRVQITKDTNGYVMRFPGISSTRVVNQYSDAPVNGTKVTLYTYSGSKSQSWGFQKVSGGYVIRSMYNQNLCLTGNGSSVATVTTYTGASNQIWTLESYCTHSSTTTKNAKSATCTATGYTGDKYCSSCGVLVSYGSTTAKLGHSTSVINKKSATCTSTGYTGDTYCSRCKTTVSSGSTIAKLGHTTSIINKKSATCTSTGYTGDTYCSRCKTTVSKGSTIAKTAHKTTVVNAKSATCTATGYSGDTKCTVCGTVTAKGTTVSKIAHKTTVVNAKSATTTTDGYTGDTKCTVCGTITKKGSVIKATGTNIDVFTFELNSDGKSYSVVDCDDSVTGGLVIPSTYKGKPVTVIGSDSIDFCENITSVVIPDSITSIGVLAFESCYALKTVQIGKNVKIIGECAFEDCSSLSSIVIPASVQTIDFGAFNGCDSLKVIKIPAGVKKIDYYALGYTNDFEKIDGFTIYGAAGSVAQIYAKENGFKFVAEGVAVLTTPTVSIKNTAKGIQVNWNKIENAQSYIVYRRVYNASTKKWGGWSKLKTGVTGTSYVDSTVKLGTQYRYTVRAVNGSVMSKYTSTATLKYNVTPTVKIANASTGIKVSWSTVANATGYTVYSSTYNAKTKKWSGWKNRGTTKATTTSWVDKSVKSGTCYKYTVRACNGKSIKSSYKGTSGLLFLSQPTVKIANAATGVKVSWNKVTGATGYTVYRSEYKNGAWTGWSNRGTAKSNKISWTDTKVTSGVQYKYTVRAVKGDYKSSYKASNTIKFTSTTTTKDAEKFLYSTMGKWTCEAFPLLSKNPETYTATDILYMIYSERTITNNLAYSSCITGTNTSINKIMSESEYNKYVKGDAYKYGFWVVYQPGEIQSKLNSTWTPGRYSEKKMADGKYIVETSKGYIMVFTEGMGGGYNEYFAKVKNCVKNGNKYTMDVYILDFAVMEGYIYDYSKGNKIATSHTYSYTSFDNICSKENISLNKLGTIKVVVVETSSGLRLQSIG